MAVVAKVLAYVERHGEAGHMEYARYRRRGLPSGSGAIESAIRRVVNLRMKGNGMIWEGENAEGMLKLRANVLCNRWDKTFAKVCQSMGSNRRLDWTWSPPDILEELNSDVPIKPPRPQPKATTAIYNTAA
jgi:hypothetical protein